MLKPHQLKSLKFKLSVDRSLDLSEMGTGKTLTVLTLIAYLKESALIICPAYLRENWKNEILKFFPNDPPTIGIVTKLCQLEKGRKSRILITSYEALKFLKDEFHTRKIIAVDEAHYLCNLRAHRTRFFHNYNWTARPKKLVLLTGTPIRNAIPDLYSLLAAIRPAGFLEKFPKYWSFARHFSHETIKYMGSIKKIEFVGAKNTNELKQILLKSSIRCKLNDIAELPEYTTENILFQIDQVSKKSQEKLWDEFRINENGVERDITNAITAKAFNALVKANYTIRWVKDFKLKYYDEPLVIFTDHRDSAEKLSLELEAPMITGSTDVSKRQKIVDGFQNGDFGIIVGTIGAMSTGFTLHAARFVLFNDLSWSPSNNAQADKRIYRVGQYRPCVKVVFSCGVVDSRINAILTRKTDAISKIL